MNPAHKSAERSPASIDCVSKSRPLRSKTVPLEHAPPSTNSSTSSSNHKHLSTLPLPASKPVTNSKPKNASSADTTVLGDKEKKVNRFLRWCGFQTAALDHQEQDEAFSRATASVEANRTLEVPHSSRNPLSLDRLMNENMDMDNVCLGPEADSIPQSSTRIIPKPTTSTGRSAKLNQLLNGTIKERGIQIRLPTERPTLAAQRELEHQRQCLASFRDNEEQWHRCHILLDPWADRDLISTALIEHLINAGRIEKFHVPEDAIEYLQSMLDPQSLYPLKSYVQLPGLRFEHRKAYLIENKELYVITNEDPFILFSQASIVNHNIRLEDLPKDEHGDYITFNNLQFNAGVLKIKKGKKAPKEDEEYAKKSRAKYADHENRIRKERDAEDAARAADHGSSTSTQTTWSEETGWSNAATSSQPTGSDPNDDYQSATRGL